MTERSRPVARRWALRLALLGLAALVAEQTWRHGHDYVFAEKFHTVEPGRLYRGAWQKPWPMRRIVRDRKIRTVVALAHPAEHPLVLEEKALADELGVRWLHIPIYDGRSPVEMEDMARRIERAADALADPANGPVFFHCHHGVNRASLTQMAYRTLHCGWTLERAKAEIAEVTGWRRTEHGARLDTIDYFYRTRVLPRRERQARALTSDLGPTASR